MVGGVYGDDLTERDDWGLSREARGLILHGDFSCDTLGILCSEHSDWDGDEIDNAIAYAILYKTGSMMSVYYMNSDEVTRPKLLGVEQWNNNYQFYETRYKAMIEFIASNIEDDRNECLKCKSPMGYKVKSQRL